MSLTCKSFAELLTKFVFGHIEFITELGLLSNYERFLYKVEFARGETCRQGTHPLPGHLIPSDLGLAYVLLVETNPFSKLSDFSGTCNSNIP